MPQILRKHSEQICTWQFVLSNREHSANTPQTLCDVCNMFAERLWYRWGSWQHLENSKLTTLFAECSRQDLVIIFWYYIYPFESKLIIFPPISVEVCLYTAHFKYILNLELATSVRKGFYLLFKYLTVIYIWPGSSSL